MGPTPVRLASVEQAPSGARASVDQIAPATGGAADGTSPTSEVHAHADYRRHLARVLSRRAVMNAAGIG